MDRFYSSIDATSFAGTLIMLPKLIPMIACSPMMIQVLLFLQMGFTCMYSAVGWVNLYFCSVVLVRVFGSTFVSFCKFFVKQGYDMGFSGMLCL